MKRNWNIKSQIALMVTTILIIVTGIEIGIILNSIANNRKNVQKELDNATLQIQNDVNLFCTEIESVVDNLYDSPKMQKFFTETNSQERFIISQYIQDIINATIYGNLNISTIKILQSNYMISTAGSSSQQALFYKANTEYGLFDLLPDNHLYTNVYMDKTTSKPYVAYVRPVFPVGNYSPQNDNSEKKIFYVLCRLDSLQRYVNSVVSTVGEMEIVVEEGGKIILSNNHSLINRPLTNSRYFQLQEKYQVSYRKIDIMGWGIYMSVPVSGIYQNSIGMLKENLIISIISLLIIVIVGWWITRNLTTPVTKLSNDINSIHGGKSPHQILSNYDLLEVNNIATYINSMLERVHITNESLMETQDNLHQSIVAKKEAELAFYQTQINPHFIYNTLECMRSIGQAYNVTEIQTISNSMAKIFRYSVKGKDIVDLSEELSCANDYFEIINIRYLNKFFLKIDVAQELLSMKIPKMILQPLTENAIGHGLSGKQEGGLVEITASCDEKNLYIIVSDDGYGIAPQRLEELNRNFETSWRKKVILGRHNGVGLDNINLRIKLDFGEEYGVLLESTLGQGTRAIVRLPIIN